MQKEFIPYEQALQLKEIGFDERCLGYYDGVDGTANETGCKNSDTWLYKPMDCDMPLKSQVFNWARNFGYVFAIHPTSFGDFTAYIFYQGRDISNICYFKTYESAEEFCIDKLIELVKKKNKND